MIGSDRSRGDPQMPRSRVRGPSETASKSWLDARRDRGRAELLEQAELVEQAPAVDELPARDAVDVDPGCRCLLPGRRHPHQLALVCAGRRPTRDDGLALSDLVVDSDPQIRERVPVQGDELAESLRAPDLLRCADDGSDEIVCDQLVNHLKAALVPDLLVEPAGDR